MDSNEPSDNTQQAAELGRLNSMPSPHPMMNTIMGAERPTALLGGTSQVEQVMSPTDTIEERQGQ